jgi:hypothetical protein
LIPVDSGLDSQYKSGSGSNPDQIRIQNTNVQYRYLPVPKSVVESKIILSAPAPAPQSHKSGSGYFYKVSLKMTYFDYINRINVTIYKNVFSSHNFFYNISSVVRRKEPELEPEPQFVISAAALVGNLISAPWFSAPAPQH